MISDADAGAGAFAVSPEGCGGLVSRAEKSMQCKSGKAKITLPKQSKPPSRTVPSPDRSG
jgi:hypothetical protein